MGIEKREFGEEFYNSQYKSGSELTSNVQKNSTIHMITPYLLTTRHISPFSISQFD